jgi:hypothetical protein
MNSAAVDVTLLTTFHREGLLAHSTLNSIERCRTYARAAGIRTEYVWVLDSVDDETRRVLSSHRCAAGDVRVIEVAHRDLGASRNSGIAAARGSTVAILDGEDYYSENWIERGYYYLGLFGRRCVVHPEVVVSFGAQKACGRMVDQREHAFDERGLLVENFWAAWTIAPREIHQAIPYMSTRATDTGFGFEDWHWNCETISAGVEHRLAPGTVAFYRRMPAGRLAETSTVGPLMPPSRLFAQKTSGPVVN